MEISVNVNAEGIDLRTPIEPTAARNPETGEWYEGEPVTLGSMVADQLVGKLTKDDSYRPLRKRFLEIRDEEIRKAVTPIIAEAIGASVQKTNSFGEPIGEPASLRDVIMAEVKKLTEAPLGRSGYGTETVLQKLVREEVGTAFKNELANIIKAEKEKVVKAIRGSASTVIADAVKSGLNAR